MLNIKISQQKLIFLLIPHNQKLRLFHNFQHASHYASTGDDLIC